MSLKEKLQEYDIEKCKTVILHVGGNDIDDGDSLEIFVTITSNYLRVWHVMTDD